MNEPDHRMERTGRQGADERLVYDGKTKFIEELQKQFGKLEHSLEQAVHGDAIQAVQDIYRIVHLLKNSAPVFGFQRVGLIAQELEQIWAWTQREKVLQAANTTENFNENLNGILDGHSNESSGVDEMTDAMAQFRRRVEMSGELSGEFMEELNLEKAIGVQEIEIDSRQGGESRLNRAISGSTLLLIDDDEEVRTYLSRRLELDGYEVDQAADVEEAKRLLQEKSYDLITLDLMMHPYSGYGLFDFLKQHPTLQWVPLIVLSARGDRADKVRCFHLGADDFVTKPFHYAELGARINRLIRRTKSMEQLAFRDPLTGVFNRRYFDQHLRTELERIVRYPAPFSIAYIDIDHFKKINDQYGHQVGDLVLQGLSHMLQKNLRTTDLLARLGGEEFVIAFPNTPGAQAAEICDRILAEARSGPIVQVDGEAYHITFSAGVAEWNGRMSADEWLKIADDTMYQAKQQGRDRVLLAKGSTDAPAATDHAIAQADAVKRVLIVDDDAILRSILVSRLRKLPVELIEAADGEEACILMQTQSFDLCILDGVMPRLDGFSLLKKLKTDDAFRFNSMKVMMMTSFKGADLALDDQVPTADEYMPKPFSLIELEIRVVQMLGLEGSK